MKSGIERKAEALGLSEGPPEDGNADCGDQSAACLKAARCVMYSTSMYDSLHALFNQRDVAPFGHLAADFERDRAPAHLARPEGARLRRATRWRVLAACRARSGVAMTWVVMGPSRVSPGLMLSLAAVSSAAVTAGGSAMR